MSSPAASPSSPKNRNQNIIHEQLAELQRMRVQLQRIMKASTAVVKNYERMRPHLHTICVSGEALLSEFMQLIRNYEGQAAKMQPPTMQPPKMQQQAKASQPRRVLNLRAKRYMPCGNPAGDWRGALRCPNRDISDKPNSGKPNQS